MKILNHIEVFISTSEIESATKQFNHDMVSDARRNIVNDIDKAFAKSIPDEKVIINHETFEKYSGPLLSFYKEDGFEEGIMPFIIDYWNILFPSNVVQQIEEAKSGRIIVTEENVEGSEPREIGVVNFELLS